MNTKTAVSAKLRVKAKMAVILAGCLCLVGVTSCAKEKTPRQQATSGVSKHAPLDAPFLPVDVMPKILTAPVKYPDEARERGEQGTVHVKALVGKDGRVTEVAAESKEPAPAALEKAALEAVKEWTFEPARAKGEPVAIWIVVPVRFKLQ
jgi:TonB family protein